MMESTSMVPRQLESESAPLERAVELACRAHRGQRYPSPEGGEPYVLHLFRVMLSVEGSDARIAAVLHDILEDTTTTAAQLLDAGMPPRVVDAVVALTHRGEDSYEEYIEVVARNDLARQVKLSDLADNLATNRSQPPSAANAARIGRYEAARSRLS